VAGSLRIALLWVVVVVSALAVTAMEREANQLQVDYGKYLLEQSAWGSLQRIENMAANNLQMRSPQPEEILMIKRQ
jgi:cell division protein FtsL